MILFLMNFDVAFDVFENCDKKRCFNSVFLKWVVEKYEFKTTLQI